MTFYFQVSVQNRNDTVVRRGAVVRRKALV